MNTEKQQNAYTLKEKAAAYVRDLTANRALLAKKLLEGSVYSLFAFLLNFCRLPFAANPFGIALLCAANKNIPFILAGLSVSAFQFDSPAILICAYLATLLARILSRTLLEPPADGDKLTLEALFEESIPLRMASSAIGVFIIGLYRLVSGGFLFFDMYATVISMVCAPLGVLLAYGVFGNFENSSYFRQISAGSIAFGALFAANEFYIFGISLSIFLGFCASLYISRTQNLFWTLTVSALCGLACAPLLSPAFVIAAVSYHFLLKVSPFFACAAAFSLSLATSTALNEVSAVLTHLPALLCASVLFGVADKLYITPRRSGKSFMAAIAKKASSAVATLEIDGDVLGRLAIEELGASREKMNLMSSSLLELSGFFGEFEKKSKIPQQSEVSGICETCFLKLCEGCSKHSVCREEKIELSADDLQGICDLLSKNGSVRSEELPTSIRSCCDRLAEYAGYINKAYTLYTNALRLSDKSEIFMLDYKGLSDMLAGIYSAHTDEFEIDRPLSEGITAALCAEFEGISSAIIYGGRQKKVMVISSDAKTLAERAHVIAARLRDALKIPFEYKERQGSLSNGVLLFTQSRAFATSAGYLSLRARGEEKFCGDTVTSFEGCDEMYYTAVCDGMGAGKEAALASRICAMFLEKTLCACTSVSLALRQLNLFMRHRNTESLRECSSGVDLLAIDPIRSKATFYKSGAAPSFVFRESNVYKVESKTLPLGIIRELDVKKTAFDLRVGDTVVMISDGVLRSQGDCPWLLDIMKKCAATHSPETLSAMIAKRAQKENGNDDISVAVIKIIDC